MPCRYRNLSSLLLAAAFFVSAVTTGCTTRTHRWDRPETVHYY